ncbi:glycosyltransferase, partial [Candidatus Entotheonella palauensis]|uniref:glycosyltransferase n=1 Tax=Candidatus Entotheonella palauensis TaxID=93172 RepID=UPI001177921D
MMHIPAITHQTGKTACLSEPYHSFRHQLLQLHPTWKHYFYDNETCRELISRELPQILPLYDSYLYDIQRVDLFRIVAIYIRGGFYVDMDVMCHKPLDDLRQYHCVLAEENTLTEAEANQLNHHDTLRVANFMFGSVPRHPFLLEVLTQMLDASAREIVTEDDILESTGPGLLTTLYHQVKTKYPELLLLRNERRPCSRCGGMSCQFGAYASHMHLGSWRWENRHEPLVQPNIDEVPRTSIERSYIRSLLNLEQRHIAMPTACHVLRTYTEEPRDGLSRVFHKLKHLGTLIDDTRRLRDQKILVPGIPFLYVDKLSAHNTNILYTTFESTALPQQWTMTINQYYDHCIVPHAAVKEVFQHSGVIIPIHVIHQGFTRYRRPTGGWSQRLSFRVGFMGVPLRRKNLHKLYKACSQLLRHLKNSEPHIIGVSEGAR